MKLIQAVVQNVTIGVAASMPSGNLVLLGHMVFLHRPNRLWRGAFYAWSAPTDTSEHMPVQGCSCPSQAQPAVPQQSDGGVWKIMSGLSDSPGVGAVKVVRSSPLALTRVEVMRARIDVLTCLLNFHPLAPIAHGIRVCRSRMRRAE